MTLRDGEEEFEHAPTVLDLGALRRIVAAADVAALPDDAPVVLYAPERAGDDLVDDYVLIGGGFEHSIVVRDSAPRDGLCLSADHPPGRYIRPKLDWDS